MASDDVDLEKRILEMNDIAGEKLNIKAAKVVEGMSKISEMTIDFFCNNDELKLEDFIGEVVTVTVKEGDGASSPARYFAGHCISAEFVATFDRGAHYLLECRPFLWFLTQSENCRIYQEKDVIAIIKDVLQDHGFNANAVYKQSGSYKTRTYCVQYRETDFDFISRLMEEEGIYYYFQHEDGKVKMVVADDVSAHTPAKEGGGKLLFHWKEQSDYQRDDDHLFDWQKLSQHTTNKVSLSDYDFEKPKTQLMSANKQARSPTKQSKAKDLEFYEYPGNFKEAGVGDAHARVKIEAKAGLRDRWKAKGNIRKLATGDTFKIDKPPLPKTMGGEFKILEATYLMRNPEFEADPEKTAEGSGEQVDLNKAIDPRIGIEKGNKEFYNCALIAQSKSAPFRAPIKTPTPHISSMQTATVVGKSGEEIYTDKYGRIKVQFHWDRDGKNDEKSSCWVRVVMPWAGKSWGMISIPRIGNEVVIQFEEGDPDKPICTGMIYNKDNMPPYALDANKTQTGIVTRSTKDGSAETFHELIFEDKKDKEFVRLQSERDYKETIKNNAEITIGLEHKDKGDLTQTIHRHKTETLNTGDMKFTVKDGSEIRKIAKNVNEEIGENHGQDVGKNSDYTVGADHSLDVGGNSDNEAGSAYTIKAGTTITVEAGTSITMKAGGASIKLDASGVTIKGNMLKLQGQAMAEVKSPATTVKGDGILTLKGGVTMIN